MEGIIKSYLASKGYGFILGKNNKDYFYLMSDVKRKPQYIVDGACVQFDEDLTPKGYKAKNIVFINESSLYEIPPTVLVSKVSSIQGWEIINKGNELLRYSSSNSPDEARRSLELLAESFGVTGLIHMRYFKTVGSSGNYNYTIHNFEGLPVSLARKSFTGIYKHEDIPDFSEALDKYLHDIAVEEDFQIRLGKYRKEMFVRYLIYGVIAAFILSVFVLIPVILVSVLYVFFSPYPEKKLRAKDEQEKQNSLKMAEF